MNTVTDHFGQEHKLNEWTVDEATGIKTMYLRPQAIRFCETHDFDRHHECNRCPYKFMGFKAHLHVQKADGIYDRRTGKRLA